MEWADRLNCVSPDFTFDAVRRLAHPMWELDENRDNSDFTFDAVRRLALKRCFVLARR